MKKMTEKKGTPKDKNQFCVVVGNIPNPFIFNDEPEAIEFTNAAISLKIPALLFPIYKVENGLIYPRKPGTGK